MGAEQGVVEAIALLDDEDFLAVQELMKERAEIRKRAVWGLEFLGPVEEPADVLARGDAEVPQREQLLIVPLA